MDKVTIKTEIELLDCLMLNPNQKWALVEEQKEIFDNKTQSFPIKFTYKEWIKFRKQLFGE